MLISRRSIFAALIAAPLVAMLPQEGRGVRLATGGFVSFGTGKLVILHGNENVTTEATIHRFCEEFHCLPREAVSA